MSLSTPGKVADSDPIAFVMDAATRALPDVRLLRTDARGPMLVQIPIGWILLRAGVELFDGRLRGFHDVEPLFAAREAAFRLALGDLSRPAVLGLFNERTWSPMDISHETPKIIQTLRKELPKVRAQFGTIEAYLRNGVPHPADADDFLIAAGDQAKLLLRAATMKRLATERRAVAAAEARRRDRLAELGLTASGAPPPLLA